QSGNQESGEKDGETEELPQFSTAEEEGEKNNLEEHRENVGGEDNATRMEKMAKKKKRRKKQRNRNKNLLKREKDHYFKESEEDEEEEQKQQPAKKCQKTSLVPITPNISKFLRGESSHTTKGVQIQNSTPKVDTELVDIEINTDNNKVELHNHIMDLMPDLNILGNDLTVKITAFEDDFNTVIILDGDNPEMAQAC
ncbi:hypothetical protein H5410_038978, partial [Solanum commersonii]